MGAAAIVCSEERPAPAPVAAGLPADALLLPLTGGALFVSRSHAVFCRIPTEHVAAVRAVLGGARPVAALDGGLRVSLARHGFFGPPRAEAVSPPTVQLQLTNACNLDCRYCCTNSGAARPAEVSFDRLLRVVRAIPGAVGPDALVALLGGEPLLVPWALDLAEEILAQGLRLTIFTNGLPLADPDLARRTAQLMRRGAGVRVSLAGPTAATCDEVSGAARFEGALRGLRQLASCGVCAAVDVMLTPAHAETAAAAVPALRRRLPPGTPLALGVLYRSGRETGAHLFRSRGELDAALDRIAFDAGETIRATAPSPVADRRDGCGCALGRHLHVRSDGALFNCFKMEEQVGDLAADDFAAAARALRARPRRATELPVCAACPLATLCGGGCRAENVLYTGEGDRPPCGPWRVQTMCELLAEDRPDAVEWPLEFLLAEARRRGFDPPDLAPVRASRHLADEGTSNQ